MQREGSPWQGLGVVFLKETMDHLTSARMIVFELLIGFAAVLTVYGATEQIKEATAEDPFIFLRLFTTSRDPFPSFVTFLSFLVPLMAIGLAFDTVNGEHNRRTMSRILSQPIYRDALLLGKFLGALVTLAIGLVALWLLVIGLGLLRLGIPPGGEEMARALVFLMVTIAYAGVWLTLAMLCSIIFRSTATALLVPLGVWLFFAVFWPLLPRFIAETILPPDPMTIFTGSQMLGRLSPSTLFNEVVVAILSPEAGSVERLLYLSQTRGAVVGAPLPLGESLLMAWPQIVGLIASTIVLFVAGYVVFQRQEVRA